MEEDKILITTQYERERFEEHFNASDNFRILFSGKYGSGKTYFLQEYFNIHKDNYEFFHLFPTNYAVSSNEDIVKLLQFDILYEIIEKGLLPSSENMFTGLETAGQFLRKNMSNIFRDVISHCSSIGKKLADIYDTSQKWLGDYESFKKQVNETESDKIINAFDKLLNDVEYDSNTEMIELTLSTIENKQKVLIIDDLDRIDPEHIFRLLNVFSAQLSNYFPAHQLTPQNENKYGFDKVIFVCDIDNIRNIYHAKYGGKTDFLGYIDKFYSIAPYYFNNNKQVAHEAHRFVQSMQSDWPDQDTRMLSSVTRLLLFHNVITLRNLVEKEFTKWELPSTKYPHLVFRFNYYSIGLVDYVIFMFGLKEDALIAIQNHREEIEIERLQKLEVQLTDLLIPFLKNDKDLTDGQYRNDSLNITINYKCQQKFRDTYTIIESITKCDGSPRTTIPIFQLLYIAIDNYCKLIEVPEVIGY